MKKHKSHARHVFTFLEKNYNITVVFGDDDDKKSSKKSSGGGKDRKSVGSSQKISKHPSDTKSTSGSVVNDKSAGSMKKPKPTKKQATDPLNDGDSQMEFERNSGNS